MGCKLEFPVNAFSKEGDKQRIKGGREDKRMMIDERRRIFDPIQRRDFWVIPST
jgi:hypothetical protein